MLKSLVYGVVDLCTAGRGVERVISGEAIRFPPRWSRYYPRDYDPAKFAFLRTYCRPGDTVFDIGAHLGVFSVTMARLVGPSGRVISFEPTPFTRGVLEQTVRLNGCEQIVEIRGEAVAGRSGAAVLHDTGAPLSNANSLVAGPPDAQGIPVPTIGLDDFVASRGLRPTCIKVDIEGAELDFLEGARATLETQRPVLEIEFHPAAIAAAGRSMRDAVAACRDLRLAILHEGRAADEAWLAALEQATDVQLVPRERLDAGGRG